MLASAFNASMRDNNSVSLIDCGKSTASEWMPQSSQALSTFLVIQGSGWVTDVRDGGIIRDRWVRN
jgi:hypothetical protein